MGPTLTALDIPPLPLVSDAELEKAINTESKVFSIYATGIVKSGNRTTTRRVHAVVDFRTAPHPSIRSRASRTQRTRAWPTWPS